VVVLYIRIRQSPRPLVKRQDKRNIMPSYHCLGLFINCDRYKPFYCSTILYFEQYIHSHFVFLYQNNSFFFCRLEVYHRFSPPESLWLGRSPRSWNLNVFSNKLRIWEYGHTDDRPECITSSL